MAGDRGRNSIQCCCRSEYCARTNDPSNKVFVVHGSDDAAKNKVALFLRTIGLEDIILRQRPNGGRHLLTKFREESEGAGFAVILLRFPDGKKKLQNRTRRV